MLFSKNAMLFIQNDIQESGFISGVTKKNCLLTLTQAQKFQINLKKKIQEIYILTVCSCHVTYAFQSEPTLYSCLNGKELLAQSNWTRIQNHLVPKRTLNHLAKLLSVRLRTKWFCVRVQLQSFLFYFVEMFCFMEILSTNEWSFYSSLFIND